ncbi:MAG: glycosyltransferase [Solidesulfovibrio magneticus str. Maddingley MBC34]|uniref:Glycosyltransferase n=1 Tax=Solidesulfovibrio magneticus str. Maddingley MBC34 TaxID=1206767 RepID=K6HF18_9BACT|nr:MAG: glycosyltransferase [Solidesulfovibrio magneticus str. Maddingley MBC34]
MKIDLHVHSKFSTRPSQWVLQKLNCPESFTEPLRIYEEARRKGMGLVTISDHNRIEGALSIAHLPGTFVSEEVTSYFPDDRCKVHVLVFDITEAMHREMQRLRENIHELVDYLRQEGIHHAVAHPLFGVNDRMTVANFEKLLLLFRNFEINGARDAWQNDCLRDIIPNLDADTIWRLADKHGIDPGYAQPWRKNLIGGSDDHSALTIASTYTEVDGAGNLAEFLAGLENGASVARGASSTPRTMARNLYSIAYQYYKHRFGIDRFLDKDVTLKVVDRFLEPGEQEAAGLAFRLKSRLARGLTRRRKSASTPLRELIRTETESLIHSDPALMEFARAGVLGNDSLENGWFSFVNRATNRVAAHFAGSLLDHVSGANVFDIFGALGSAGALYTMLAPYFLAYSIFTKDRQFSSQARLALTGQNGKDAAVRVAHFTDTFHEINGVSGTLRQQAELAIKTGKCLSIYTCDHGPRVFEPGVQQFTPIGVYSLAEYPDQKLYYPPLLEMLHSVYAGNFTRIHSATPGPIGLAALCIAKTLRLPIYGTYHTALPQYAQILTGDEAMEDLTWKCIIWYYNQMDLVYVPSKETGRELTEKGLDPAKLRLFPRGVDVIRFDPAKRDTDLAARFGLGDGPRLLYAGRVSREKDLHLLATAFRRLVGQHPEATLCIVGDGPYLDELRAQLSGTPTVFTGYREGEELAGLFAACDLFVFPSATDTFGNVVLEAQASGLPIIVTNQGGPMENIVPGETGVVVPAGDAEALHAAMAGLLADPELMRAMGRAGRDYAEKRTIDQAFEDYWKMYEDAPGAPPAIVPLEPALARAMQRLVHAA